jgi:AraC-like DNA-binding protein/mannose-6-phosphate isomerase-like protein (cupin superfamily)
MMHDIVHRSPPLTEAPVHGFENMRPAQSFHCAAFLHGAADIAYHWHREMEVLFVLRGRVRLVIDGQVCEMGAEDLVIINPDVTHNSTSMSRDALVCGVHLNTAHYERLGLPGFSARKYLCRTFLHSRSFMKKVAPLKAMIARLALHPARHAEEPMVQDLVGGLLACFIYRHIPHENRDIPTGSLRVDSRDRILRIMNRLAASRDMVHLGLVAEQEGVTLSHLSRLFKSHLGMGYRDYLHTLKLDAAAADLRATTMTIEAIMERNGFGNPAVFYNKFKVRFGHSPARFRKSSPDYRPSAGISTEDAREARLLLARHAGEIGRACELAVGIAAPAGRSVTLSAPHQAFK